MWKRILSLLVLLSLTLCLLTLGACGAEERLMEHFPEWEEAQGELSELEIDPSIELEFQGINFEAYSSDNGEMYDEVLVHLSNTSDKQVSQFDTFIILYLYKNRWYVLHSALTERPFAMWYAARAERDISFLVPSGLFDIPGQYKLWNESVGFCDIDIVFVPE